MIKFVEVKKIRDFNVMERRASCRFELDEIWINPASILQIKPDIMMKKNFESGYLPDGLDTRQQFSRINFGTGSNLSSVTVVGTPEGIAEQIFKTVSTKQVLRG
tara:strand:- start:141 stop:452 length:312 start_codon:yes stop_codon:yes gene_type:complete